MKFTLKSDKYLQTFFYLRFYLKYPASKLWYSTESVSPSIDFGTWSLVTVCQVKSKWEVIQDCLFNDGTLKFGHLKPSFGAKKCVTLYIICTCTSYINDRSRKINPLSDHSSNQFGKLFKFYTSEGVCVGIAFQWCLCDV